MQLSFFDRTRVNGSTTLDDLLRITDSIDIELLSENEEEAIERINLFANYGIPKKQRYKNKKWYQINSPNKKLNVFSYYEKEGDKNEDDS